MVRFASCEETMIGPLATPEAPLTTIFQVRSSAPPSAFMGIDASFCPSGMAMPPAEPTPGGFQGR